MILVSILVTILVLIVTWYLWNGTRKPPKFPPGPARYPFFGSIPYFISRQMDKDGKVTKLHPLLHLLDRFGDTVGFYLGSGPAIVCSDYETIKNLLKMEETTGRPSYYPMNELRPGWELLNGTENEGQPPGVIFIDGKFWREQRRFLLKNLRDFGFGKSWMEDCILEDAQKLVNEISKLVGQPATLTGIMEVAVVNTLWAILVGEKLEFNDPHSMKIVKCMDKLVRESPDFRPPISYFLPSQSMLKWKIFEPFTKRSDYEKVNQDIYDILASILNKHIKSHDPENIKDFMDLMIKESNETEDPESSFYKEGGIIFMINDITELFLAGMETTSSTLMWTFLYMLHHPQVKRKVQRELKDVFGNNDPCLGLRSRCHYTNAVLHESLRLTAVLPFVEHRATEEVSFGNYIIPKNTMIIACLLKVMRDSSYFKDADKFIPERFIDPDGMFRNDERVIAFGIGKRQCIGQSLAEKQYFLFFTMIMKKLDMNPVPGEELPSYDVSEMKPANFVRSLPKFKMILSKR